MPKTGTLEDRLAAYVAGRREQMERDPAPFIVFNEFMILAHRDEEVRRVMAGLLSGWNGYLVSVCLEAGDDPATAAKRAESCRMELLGLGLALGVCRLS